MFEHYSSSSRIVHHLCPEAVCLCIGFSQHLTRQFIAYFEIKLVIFCDICQTNAGTARISQHVKINLVSILLSTKIFTISGFICLKGSSGRVSVKLMHDTLTHVTRPCARVTRVDDVSNRS